MADPPPLLWCCASQKKSAVLRTAIYLDVPYYNITQGILRYGYMYRCPRHKELRSRTQTHAPTHPQTHAPTRPRTGRSAKSDGRTDGPIPTHKRPRQLQSPSLSLCTSKKISPAAHMQGYVGQFGRTHARKHVRTHTSSHTPRPCPCTHTTYIRTYAPTFPHYHPMH